MKNVAAGSNPISLTFGLEKAKRYLTNQILEYARPIENNMAIEQVATISSGKCVELIWPITELYFRQILSTDFMNRFYLDVKTVPYAVVFPHRK